VRGSIDMSRVAAALAVLRGRDVTDWHVGLDAALVALSGRVRLTESSSRASEDIVRELYEDVFGPPPRDGDDYADDRQGDDATGEGRARRERAAVL
jgi:MoxR-like ATPase